MNAVQEKEETDTDFLARLMADGFTEVRGQFAEINKRFAKIDLEFVEVKDRLLSLERGQLEIFRNLDIAEKERSGVLFSLDETVTRPEFIQLTKRVEALEA